MKINFFPEQASEYAAKVDWLNDVITVLSVFFTLAIVGSMLLFAIRYRRSNVDPDQTPRIEGNTFIEIIWTVVPTLICIYLGYYGVVTYSEMRKEEKNPLEINVWGQKWKWDFEYKNGKKTVNEFVVPVGQQVKLVMKSRDVLHSFFVPAMRAKRDVVPGTYNALYFKPIKTGTYQTFCAEYCGLDHSKMLAKLHVVSQAEYERWFDDRSEEIALARMSPAEQGEKLYVQKGCNACHSMDGSRLVGPSFLNLYGKKERSAEGAEIKVDENYLQESILDSNKVIVEGYPPNMMPAFEGQVNEKELDALIAFIKSVDDAKAAASKAASASAAAANAEAMAKLSPADRGKQLYSDKVCITCHSLDGSKLVGPSFKALFGKSEKWTDGSSAKVDEGYLRESILNPMAKIVEGYPPGMPPYQGQLNDQQVADLIEFIKTVQ